MKDAGEDFGLRSVLEEANDSCRCSSLRLSLGRSSSQNRVQQREPDQVDHSRGLAKISLSVPRWADPSLDAGGRIRRSPSRCFI